MKNENKVIEIKNYSANDALPLEALSPIQIKAVETYIEWQKAWSNPKIYSSLTIVGLFKNNCNLLQSQCAIINGIAFACGCTVNEHYAVVNYCMKNVIKL